MRNPSLGLAATSIDDHAARDSPSHGPSPDVFRLLTGRIIPYIITLECALK